MNPRTWTPIFVASAAATTIAMIGAAATDLGPWYQVLRVPAWKPPDWAFGPGWTIIFSLTATAGVRAWWDAPSAGHRRNMLLLFGLNGAFNALWSLLFFGMRRPDWALQEVVLLWLSVLSLLIYLGRFSRPARWLLAPYLAWVTFAGTLNLSIVRLNPPFGVS